MVFRHMQWRPLLFPAPLKIGSITLATPLLLAPIAGYCDVAYRLVVRRLGGVGLACTDLLSPEGLLRRTRGTMELAATCPEDTPLAVQLYGANADSMCEAARFVEDQGPAVIDINMGCPVDKVTKRDGGSRLLCDPDRAVTLASRVRQVLRHTPLTCKLRLGWDDSSIIAPQLARRLEEAGIDAVTVHGRTTEMLFSGQCRLDGIAAVVAAVRSIPIIGNGDVRSPEDAQRMIEQTGCAGVMIGRAALSAPWIFRETWSYLSQGAVPPPLTLQQKCQLMREHFHDLCRFRGQQAAVRHFRQRISWYGKQLNPCRILRDGMRTINTPADFERVIDAFLEWRREHDRTSPEPPPTPPLLDHARNDASSSSR
jgi:nifR3 family TIM-barrel protein